jgi:hypothetical protein
MLRSALKVKYERTDTESQSGLSLPRGFANLSNQAIRVVRALLVEKFLRHCYFLV